MKLLFRHAVFCCASLAAPAAFATCGAAFCTVNTNWDAHGAWAEPGWRFDLRYEHILQDHATSPFLHPASTGLLCTHQRCWLLHAVSSAWRFAMQFIGVSQLDHAQGAVKNMLSIF